jgi:hypothetical protein
MISFWPAQRGRSQRSQETPTVVSISLRFNLLIPGQISAGVLADVNGDGFVDLITSQEFFLGNGNGGFGPGTSFPSTDGENTSCVSNPGCIVVADVNADGKPDVVSVNNSFHTITVFMNDGNATFHQQGASTWVGWLPSSANVVDVNGDGRPDIIAVNSGSSDVTALLGNGDGTFRDTEVRYATGGFSSYPAVVADFSQDGKLDVVVSDGPVQLCLHARRRRWYFCGRARLPRKSGFLRESQAD